jgi:beta-1,4-N-acetylglucosaminyltransferase
MKTMKIGIVVSPGGHLAQALEVLPAFEGHEIFLISYKVPNLIGFRDARIKNVYLLTFLGAKRVRLFISLFISLFSVYEIFFREKPDVIFSTGSEIAIGPFYIGKFLFGSKLIYLETATRVVELSLTAKILYNISDLFLVQWETLLNKYRKKAQYRGCLYDICNNRE